MNWVCYRTEIFPIKLQCLFSKMALPACVVPILLLGKYVIEVVIWKSSQVFSISLHSQAQLYYLGSQSSVPATAAVRVRKLSSAADGNGCLLFRVQNKSFSPVFLSLWSFTSETFLKVIFSSSEVFLLSCRLFLLYLNQKWMAYQNCLKSLGACVAEHAAKIAIETLRRLN